MTNEPDPIEPRSEDELAVVSPPPLPVVLDVPSLSSEPQPATPRRTIIVRKRMSDEYGGKLEGFPAGGID